MIVPEIKISDLAVSFLANYLYDSSKKLHNNNSDIYSNVYKEAFGSLSKKYPKLKIIHIDSFLDEEVVRKEILNYVKCPDKDKSFQILKVEFLKLFDDRNYFTEKDSEDILKDFFKIIDSTIVKYPSLKSQLDSFTLNKMSDNISILSKNSEHIKDSSSDIIKKLDEIFEFVKETNSTKITNPQSLEPIPIINNFIGRTSEINELIEANSQVIIINGISGIGKTYIASQFAHKMDSNNNVYWHTLNELDTLEIILEDLAIFLKVHNYLDPYDIITKELNNYNYLLDKIIESLESDNFFLFFDDFHLIKDEKIKVMFDKFKKRFKKTKVIVVTQPDTKFKFYDSYDTYTGRCLHYPLKGFNYTESKEKLLNLNCRLDDDLFSNIHQKTDGHPIALELISIAAKDNFDLNSLLKLSPSFPEGLIEYLFEVIYSKLSRSEQEFLKCISIFRIPITIDTIEHIFIHEDIVQTSIKLKNKFLIEMKEGFCTEHQLIKNISYHLLSNKEKESYHEKAVEYLLEKKFLNLNEVIELQYHLFSSKNYELSALVTLQTHHYLIMQGYVTPLLEILLAYEKKMLPYKIWIAIGNTIGNLYLKKLDFDNAEKYFTELLDSCYETRYELGLPSLLSGLSLVASGNRKYDKALEYQKRALNLYQRQNNVKGKASVALNIGTIHFEKRNIEDALYYCREAISEIEKIKDPISNLEESSDIVAKHEIICGCLNLLGNIYEHAGSWEEATKYYINAKSVALENGYFSGVATTCANLGNIYANQGLLDEAEEEFFMGLEFAIKSEDVHATLNAYSDIGTLLTDKDNYIEADKYYRKSLEISEKHGLVKEVTSTYSNIAINYLKSGEIDNALINCKRSIKYAKISGDLQNFGSCLKTLGNIQEKKGKKSSILLYKKCIEICDLIGDEYTKAHAFLRISIYYINRSNFVKACEYSDESIILFEKYKSYSYCTKLCSQCIEIYRKEENLDKVVEYQEKKLHYCIMLNNPENVSSAYNDLISVLVETKNLSKAIPTFKNKIEFELNIRNKKEAATIINEFAIILRDFNEYKLAIKYSKIGIRLAAEIGENDTLAKLYNTLGNTYLHLGIHSEAKEFFVDSIILKSSLGDKKGTKISYSNLGYLYIKQKDFQRGEDILKHIEKTEQFKDIKLHGKNYT